MPNKPPKFGSAMNHITKAGKFKAGGPSSVKRLRELEYDPIYELVELANKLKWEIEYQERIRSGELTELSKSTGKVLAYRPEVHHALYDKLVTIGDKLVRYNYGRVSEVALIDDKPVTPLIVNLTGTGEVYRANSIGNSADDFDVGGAIEDDGLIIDENGVIENPAGVY